MTQRKTSFGVDVLAAGISACTAEVATIPLDTCKVRLQIQGELQKGTAGLRHRGMAGALTTIVKEEGALALYRGLPAGLLRQSIFSPIRLGCYAHIRDAVSRDPSNPVLLERIAAAMCSGALGMLVASPADMVKIRLQAEGRLPPGVPRRYTGVSNALVTVYRADGVRGLWRGLGPNLARNSVMNAAEVASYDYIKDFLMRDVGMAPTSSFFAASAAAGFIATCVASPIDVVKTRVMNAKAPAAGEQPLYRNALDCFVKVVRMEGVRGLYKGFLPNYCRVGAYNLVLFNVYEKVKAALETRL